MQFFKALIPRVRPILLWLINTDELKNVSALRMTVRLMLLSSLAMVVTITATTLGHWQEPGRVFREGHLMTWWSFFLLLGVAFFSEQTWKVLSSGEQFDWKKEFAIWRIMAIAFAFFAADEMFRIHEEVDRYLHKSIGMDPKGPTDALDDLIVGGYGIAALYYLFRYRRHLYQFRGAIPYFVAAFAFATASIVGDFVSGSRSLSVIFIPGDAKVAMTWLSVLEEVFKIYCEVIFLGAFAYCYSASLEKVKQAVIPRG